MAFENQNAALGGCNFHPTPQLKTKQLSQLPYVRLQSDNLLHSADLNFSPALAATCNSV
jgi:hypothetical protein